MVVTGLLINPSESSIKYACNEICRRGVKCLDPRGHTVEIDENTAKQLGLTELAEKARTWQLR